MDLFEVIRDDHERVLGIIDSLEAAPLTDTAMRLRLRDELVARLTAHARAEEVIFYPLLQNDTEGHERVVMAEEQHHIVKVLLQELADLPISDEHFGAKLALLAENLEAHLDEEEEDIIPLVEDLIDDSQAENLGDAFLRHVHDTLGHGHRAA